MTCASNITLSSNGRARRSSRHLARSAPLSHTPSGSTALPPCSTTNSSASSSPTEEAARLVRSRRRLINLRSIVPVFYFVIKPCQDIHASLCFRNVSWPAISYQSIWGPRKVWRSGRAHVCYAAAGLGFDPSSSLEAFVGD